MATALAVGAGVAVAAFLVSHLFRPSFPKSHSDILKGQSRSSSNAQIQRRCSGHVGSWKIILQRRL